ncbi:MAG TPA: pyridoxal phosphate-dependent aminotransferase [Oligoflexia bacterium]|nr:pyridoxal phosphate-dependent aminotransferase [Oligoflexia bacterium]HMP26630.1 pyridoxal phosphate-dependent aminotransferase [Oligoflexia bacterium]
MRISERGKIAPASPIRKLYPLADQAKLRGVDVYYLNIGQPDVASPEAYFEGIRSFSSPVVEYQSSQGIQNLRAAWAEYLSRSLNIKLKSDNFVITAGASEALLFAFASCADVGDEMIVFEPTYTNYFSFANTLGFSLIGVPLEKDSKFSYPSIERCCHFLTERTKAILICSPNNPTGTTLTKLQLDSLIQFAREKSLWLIVDETYRELIFDGVPISALAAEGSLEHVVVIDSFSKRFSLCGARIGSIISYNKELMNVCLKLAQARLSVSTVEQVAALRVLENSPDEFIKELVVEFKSRRDLFAKEFLKIKDAKLYLPDGAFYAIAELPVDDATSFAEFMLTTFNLEKETVFITPAEGFYLTPGMGRNQARFAFVLAGDRLRRAVEILAAGLASYNSQKH